MLSLSEKHDIGIEMISKPREEFSSEAYAKLDLPVAPAIMVGEEIVVEKSDVSEEKVESVICKHLDLPLPDPPKKGILGRFTNR